MAYEVVTGVFEHAPTDGIAPGFSTHSAGFGISNHQASDRWRRIQQVLDDDPSSKLLIIGRHGQGMHNLGQLKYGHELWSKEKCFQQGDDELTWGPDAVLSPLGEEQAAAVGRVWVEELSCVPPIPKPTAFYCSPLRRTAKTLSLTFESAKSCVGNIAPQVKVRESLREKLDAHTPDQRLPMRFMRAEHPTWPVEAGASEEDVYWRRDWVEGFDEYSRRAGVVVDEIFDHEDRCVSITAHEGIIQGLLHYINHPISQPPPGCAFGVLLRKVEQTA